MLNVIDENGSAQSRVLSGHGETQSKLYLRPGSYRMTAMDTRGHFVSSSDIVIGKAEAAAQ